MERALLEQQARADQAATALQALQQQQQQSATTAQQAQRRAAAAQAAGAGASAAVDTRLLSKPMAFDGRETSWRSFKFHFVAYCGAIDSRLKDLLVLGETRDVAAMRNIHMDPDMRALSAQLYYMLIMVCQEGAQKLLEHAGHTEGGVAWRRLLDEYEPRTAGRLCALLQELLHHGFHGDPRTALDEFKVLLRRYSALSGVDVSESLKVALVQKGVTDDTLKTHLVLHASRLSTFQMVREEVRSVLITRQALGQGPVPMDIGALDAKGKGKGKGKSKGKNKDKGKAKDKPDAELTCFCCGKLGHRKAACWGWQAAQKEKEKEKSAAKNGDTPKKGAKKEVAAVDVGSLEVGPLSVCARVCHERWCQR